MNDLRQEARTYRDLKEREVAEARQIAALQISCGMDLEAALRAGSAERQRIRMRIERSLRRERQKGIDRHWSYDLNRHIALKQALDRLG